MKTLKLLMLATFVSFAMVSFAGIDQSATKLVYKQIINLTFEEAIQIQGLSMAMHQQLDGAFLLFNQQSYTVEVEYMNRTVRITGTQAQWVWFFKSKLIDARPPKT
jgi:hypothetical protein